MITLLTRLPRILSLQCRRVIRHIPLVHGLVYVRASDHKEALREWGLSLILSTVPIWLGFLLFLTARKIAAAHGVVTPELAPRLALFFQLNFSNGEFFIYATATLSPLIYLIFKDYPTRQQFPSKWWFLGISLVILILCGAFFAMSRIDAKILELLDWDAALVLQLSSLAYVISLALVYVTLVYRNFFESGAAHVDRESTHDFVDDYVGRHGTLP